MALPRSDLFYRYFKEGTQGECWPWCGSTNGAYGIVQIPEPRKNVLAHRFAYSLLVGKLEPGMVVMHICDNPLCVNPKHLILESQKENLNDMRRKGRGAKMPNVVGVNNGRAKLTPEDVVSIRCSSNTTKQLATKFGVSMSTASAVKTGRLWRSVA